MLSLGPARVGDLTYDPFTSTTGTHMRIGVPKEIKTNENRIALVPAGAEALVAAGHEVLVEKGGGRRQRLRGRDVHGRRARRSRPTPTRSGRDADMIMKVKEPIAVGVAAHAPRAR